MIPVYLYTPVLNLSSDNISQVLYCLLYITKGPGLEFNGKADQRSIKGGRHFAVIIVDLLKTSAIFGVAF